MSAWRSLRVRLTAAFLVLTAATLSLVGVTVVRFVRQITLGTIDTVLLEEAVTLAGLADLHAAQLAEAVRRIGVEPDVNGRKFVHVEDAGGRTLTTWRRLPAPVARARPRTLDEANVSFAGHDALLFRVAWAPIPGGGRVAIGTNAAQEMRALRRVRWGVATVAAVLLAVLGGAVWSITGRVTREIDRLAQEVSTIEAGSLERRLAPRRTHEVDRLVTVLNRVLERLERSIEQLRRFTADAAHELRTPLTAIRTRLEVGLYRESDAISRDVVVDALEQTERLRRLAEDLLMLARVEGGAVRTGAMDATVDLSRVVEEVATSMMPLAEEDERPFRWRSTAGLIVRGSEVLLKRAFLNLVDNAFRHTPPVAAVAVDARRTGADAVVEVVDAGPGIDPAVAPHLFERFRHGAGGGSGLGLALVREIVERHGGTVSVEARAGGGTAARVSLPLDGGTRS